MKFIFTVVCSMLFYVLQTSAVLAGDWKADQAKADQYYEEQHFGQAFNVYLKLAKIGVSRSQNRVSQMYANGIGTKVNLRDAYAWSVLAAQRGSTEMEEKRDSLLQQTSNKAAAEKKAEKLLSKYGREALQKKADSKAKLKHNTKSGGCTGSKLGCR